MYRPNRRCAMKSVAAAVTAGLGEFAFLRGLPPVSASDANLSPHLVQLNGGIEPLVRLLEATPRDRLLEEVADKIRKGVSYRELLAALFLATVRNVEPRPSVGFKFHAVLVVNSAHLASLASADQDRWLPIFWALDYFKGRQLEEERRSGWKLPPVDESAVPPASAARKAFVDAMDRWDEEAADAAVAGLARSASSSEIYELLFRYGARDYRSIGHKAIFVANSCRTLHCIGWHHAEPVLRSLVYALLNHTDEPNPATSDLGPDQAWRQNLGQVEGIRHDWLDGQVDSGATATLVDAFRDADSAAAAELAIERLNAGVSPRSVWDAVFLGAGELLMRQPGIIGLHALTTANALHYAYQTAANDETRRMLLLQNCAFLPLFRQSAADRGSLSDARMNELQPGELESEEPLREIFADISRDRTQAARKLLSYRNHGNSASAVLDEARRMVFLKGNDAHDYKFSSAVLENYWDLSADYRDRFLALSVFNLVGAGGRDNGLVQRVRAALS